MKFINYLNESTARHAFIYKAKNKKWYLELGDQEYAERHQSTTYGPFDSEEAADKEISDYHSNPGGMTIDRSGKRPVPKKSPNRRPIQKPVRQRRDGAIYFRGR